MLLKIQVVTSLLLVLSTWGSSLLFAEDEVVHVYSARIETLIKPAFDAFTKETGIQVKYFTAKEAELIERLKAEGKYTPADILVTVDAGNLWYAAEQDLLQPVKSDVLEANIPSHLQDPQNRWFGMTIRARTIVYSTERVSPADLSTYEDLGNPKWKGKLCLRTAKKVYNQSLVGTMIQALGKDNARQLLEGWVANQPSIESKDSGVLKSIVAGKCDVGIVNTYYLGRELKKDPKFPVALFWANQKDRGVHVNISGAGIVKHSKNVKNAQKLLEFLSSPKAQNLFADHNMEYPANPKVEASPLLQKWWGSFKMDEVPVDTAGSYQREAVRLMEQVGYR